MRHGRIKGAPRRRIIATLWDRQAGACCWCQQPMTQDLAHHHRWDFATIEHLRPRVYGGGNELSNLALAHAKCNGSREHRAPGKGDRARRVLCLACENPEIWVDMHSSHCVRQPSLLNGAEQ